MFFIKVYQSLSMFINFNLFNNNIIYSSYF